MKKSATKYYQYFVEGEDEKKIINTLKSDMGLIQAGKVQVVNCVQEKLTPLRLMSLKDGTAVVLVFDTDAGNLTVLKENIKLLQTQRNISEVICVLQVKNLEDELVRSCNIKQIKYLLGVGSNKEYKGALIKEKNLSKKLGEHEFDISKFWSSHDDGIYKTILNEAGKIKRC